MAKLLYFLIWLTKIKKKVGACVVLAKQSRPFYGEGKRLPALGDDAAANKGGGRDENFSQ